MSKRPRRNHSPAFKAKVALAAELPASHRDPVDRTLIVHALTSRITLATADAHIRRYPVPLL